MRRERRTQGGVSDCGQEGPGGESSRGQGLAGLLQPEVGRVVED